MAPPKKKAPANRSTDGAGFRDKSLKSGRGSNLMTQGDLEKALSGPAMLFAEQHAISTTHTKRVIKRTMRDLLGDAFKPGILPPTVALAIWAERKVGDPDCDDPTQFLETHWGKYLDEAVLDQCTLRRLDVSLFDAIKSFCRNRNLDPQKYLPPPARRQAKPQYVSMDILTPSAQKPHHSASGPGRRQAAKHQSHGGRAEKRRISPEVYAPAAVLVAR